MVVARSPALSFIAALFAAGATGALVGVAGPVVAVALFAVPVVAYVGLRVAVRAVSNPSAVILPTIAASLVITQLPVMFSYSQPLRLASVGFLSVVALISLARPARLRIAAWPAAITGLFVAVLVLTLARGAITGANGSKAAAALSAVQFLAVFAIVLGAARSSETNRDLVRVCVALALAPAAFIGVNLVLLAASWGGLPIPMPEQISVALDMDSSTLAAIGINLERVQMPLAGSINNVGVVAAAGIAAGLVLAARGGRRRLGLTAAAICLAGVTLSDTRTALVVALVVAILAIARPVGRWATAVAVVLPLSPFLVVWGVGQLAESIGGALSGGGRTFATGSNRFLIWERAIDVAEHPAGFGSHLGRFLFGYGGGGHIESGAAYKYEFLFRSQEYRLAHTHNVAIQTVLDSGLVGLASLVAVALVGVLGLGRMVKAIGGAASAALAMFVVLLGGGVTEVVPTYISPEALSLALMALAVAIVRPRTA